MERPEAPEEKKRDESLATLVKNVRIEIQVQDQRSGTFNSPTKMSLIQQLYLKQLIGYRLFSF